MKNKGIIREINETSIKIELYKDSSCAHCSQCDSKSHKLQTFFYDKKDLKLDEIVEFEIDDKNLLKVSFLIYICPLIFMFISYALAARFNLSENKRIFSSFLGLIISFALTYAIDKRKGKELLTTIKITKENFI